MTNTNAQVDGTAGAVLAMINASTVPAVINKNALTDPMFGGSVRAFFSVFIRRELLRSHSPRQKCKSYFVAMLAALATWYISNAVVTAPTPPGTGVIAAAPFASAIPS